MDKKINVLELLKDCPLGTELDCTMYNSVTLLSVDDSDKEDITFPIRVLREDGNYIALTKYGQYTDADFAKCVIFPKGKTTWADFRSTFNDGDVCYVKTKALFEHIFIFKVSEDYNYIQKKYVNLSGNTFFADENPVCATEQVKEIRLATKEEKQKLFDAIKRNGYKWNEETKTLEKLIEPKFKAGDRIIDKNNFMYRIKKITATGYILQDLKNTFISFEEAELRFIKVIGASGNNCGDIDKDCPFDAAQLLLAQDVIKWLAENRCASINTINLFESAAGICFNIACKKVTEKRDHGRIKRKINI